MESPQDIFEHNQGVWEKMKATMYESFNTDMLKRFNADHVTKYLALQTQFMDNEINRCIKERLPWL